MKTSESSEAMRITIGADPEFFVHDKTQKKTVPACGLFGGGKGNPLFLSPDGGFLEDGCAIELNVTPQPSLAKVKEKILGLMLVWENTWPNYTLEVKAHNQFTKAALKDLPQANTIGCSADYWAYGIRELPQIERFKGNRYAGGHIHVGIDPWPKDLEPHQLVKWLDATVLMEVAGVNGVDGPRWEFYGHHGLYRTTNYGVEWRSPDNTWCSAKNAMADFFVSSFDASIQKFVKFYAKYKNAPKNFGKLVEDYLEQQGYLAQFQNKKVTMNAMYLKGYQAVGRGLIQVLEQG